MGKFVWKSERNSTDCSDHGNRNISEEVVKEMLEIVVTTVTGMFLEEVVKEMLEIVVITATEIFLKRL